MTNPTPYIIRSSHGNVHVRRSTGKVIRIENNGQPSELKGVIDRFDLPSAPPDTLAATGECDILDIGYWTTAGAYEPPVTGWREG